MIKYLAGGALVVLSLAACGASTAAPSASIPSVSAPKPTVDPAVAILYTLAESSWETAAAADNTGGLASMTAVAADYVTFDTAINSLTGVSTTTRTDLNGLLTANGQAEAALGNFDHAAYSTAQQNVKVALDVVSRDFGGSDNFGLYTPAPTPTS